MPICAAAFDRQIEIWRDQPGVANALNEVVSTPALVAKVWASRNYITRQEKVGGAQFNASEMTKFTVRYSSISKGFKDTDRLRYAGIDYNIKSIQEFGYCEAFDIYCEGVQA